MSRNHENVVWQSPDGTWNRGMFVTIPCYGDDCEDETHEWCTDFDQDAFEWVSSGHATERAALDSWDGANPGGHNGHGPYDELDERSREWVDQYEDMAAQLYENAAQRAREADGRGGFYTGFGGRFTSNRSPAYWGYHGPPRQRSLKAITEDRNQTERAQFSYKLAGYANDVAEQLGALQKKVADRLATATDEERRAYLDSQKSRRDALQEMLDKHREQRHKRAREQARFNFGYRYDPDAARRQKAMNEAEAAVEQRIAGIDKKRVEQDLEFFPPAVPVRKAPAKKTTPPAPKKTAAKPAPKTTAKKAPAKKAPARKAVAQPAARAKTTAKSTAGSFAAVQRAEADVQLIDVDDLWGSP